MGTRVLRDARGIRLAVGQLVVFTLAHSTGELFEGTVTKLLPATGRVWVRRSADGHLSRLTWSKRVAVLGRP
jgi:hypothetical protein